MTCHVTTVMTLANSALIAFDLLSKGVLATDEEEEHVAGKQGCASAS